MSFLERLHVLHVGLSFCMYIILYVTHVGTHSRSPYCRLGIVNQKHIESSSEFKFLSEWQKAGAVAEVASTSTKPATVEPVWNEDIKL